MAKRRPTNGQTKSNGQPGTRGDQAQRRNPALRRSPRAWTFELILTDLPVQLDDHPLAGLSPEQREDVRAQAFGRVLAAIAIRKTEPERNRDAIQADGQYKPDPKSLTELE